MTRLAAATGTPRRIRAADLLPDLAAAGDDPEPGDEPTAEQDQLPFGERLVAFATEGAELVERARERARLRAKEGRPAFSTTTERALRAIRESVDDLLAPDEPEPAPAPPDEPAAAATTPAPEPARPPRFRSDEEWLAYLARMN